MCYVLLTSKCIATPPPAITPVFNKSAKPLNRVAIPQPTTVGKLFPTPPITDDLKFANMPFSPRLKTELPINTTDQQKTHHKYSYFARKLCTHTHNNSLEHTFPSRVRSKDK
jgi:hypothetical protein